ncbi:MAG: hypothetical protein ACP5HS_03790 [Anaerolineae bacterium]
MTSGPQFSTAQALLQMAAALEDPIVAYLCAWTAFNNLVHVAGRRAGVRPQFALRKNGTLQVRKADGRKMPVVTPPRNEHLLSAALGLLRPEAASELLTHPSLRHFADRVPRVNGRPLPADAYKQRITGVVDLSLTVDARYPVWYSLDRELVRQAGEGTLTQETQGALLLQVAQLLRAIYHDLISVSDPTEGEANVEVATYGLPLLTRLVEGLIESLCTVE